MPLDVVLTGDTSRTLNEIENRTNVSSIIWIILLQNRDHWLTEYGAPLFKEALLPCEKNPGTNKPYVNMVSTMIR